MASWKLPLIVAAIVVPIVAGFMVGGGGVGLGAGALVVLGILVVAIRQRPFDPIVSAPAGDGRRHVLIVAPGPVEDPGDIARIASVAGIGGAEGEEKADVLVLVPARIGFLDRWASDVEAARHRAQQHLVVTVAALAKAGIAAEARVGDEDVVQAVEDLLQSFPATEVVLVEGDSENGGAKAASELRSRLRAEFRQVRLGGAGRRQPAR
jgi:hypothetical protein